MTVSNNSTAPKRRRPVTRRVARWLEPRIEGPATGLPYWRERVLITLLFVFIVLELFAFVPSAWLASRANLYELILLDTVFLFAATALFLMRSIPLRTRSTIAVCLFYVAGVYLMLRIGPLSGGPLWLFVFPVMTGVLLGVRPALAALAINALTILAIGWAIYQGHIATEGGESYTPTLWALIGFNLLLLNAAVTLALAVLLQGLDTAFVQERIVSTALARERQQLLEANEQLETAMTERQRAEHERIRLVQAVDQAAEVIVVTDLEGVITYVNPALELATGYRPDEVIGQSIQTFFNAPETASRQGEMWQALRRGEVWGGRIRSTRRDGRPYEVELTCSPVSDDTHTSVGYLAVMRDTTRERKLETRLRQTQKLEAIGTLAGGIAHDFNNILVPILGFAEMLKRTLPEDSLEQQRADRIVRASERGRELVRQILTFSRKVDVTRQLVHVDQVVLEALHLLRPSVPHNVKVEHKLSANAMPILADPTQIHQIIMNLCTNACHAMEPNGGLLKLRLDSIDCSPELLRQYPGIKLELEQRYLRLAVQDTGAGMDNATAERIFDPFFTTKSEGQGTGLGLATVHGIVSELDGAVTVESELKRGSTFTLFLPVAPVVEEAETVVHRFSVPNGHQRVMLVDDEEMVLQCEEEVLRSLGYRVMPFSGPHAALEFLRHSPQAIDMIVTDLTMPGMSGMEFAEEACAIKPGIPIVIATGYSERLRREQLERLGIEQVLLKPFSRDELAKTMQTANKKALGKQGKAPNGDHTKN